MNDEDEDESLRIDMDLIHTHEGESESIATFHMRKRSTYYQRISMKAHKQNRSVCAFSQL